MTHEKHTCSTCHNDRPAAGTFCPFCGAHAEVAHPPVNQRAILAFTPTAEISLGDASRARRWQKGLLGTGVALATAAAVGAGLFAGSWLIEHTPRQPAVAKVTAPVVAEAAAPTPARTPVLMVRDVPNGFDIVVGDEVMHSVRTAEQSRYETLAERKRAVTVRLDHVIEKTDGRFEARAAGGHYEVVWTDGTASFRLFDVTAADSKALGDDAADLSANLAADRMNAATERPVAPVSRAGESASNEIPS